MGVMGRKSLALLLSAALLLSPSRAGAAGAAAEAEPSPGDTAGQAVPPTEKPAHPLSGITLALVLTETTSSALDSLDRYIAEMEAGFGEIGDTKDWLAQDIDSRQFVAGLMQILAARFKNVGVFDSVEAAVESGRGLILTVDLYYLLGTWPGEKTEAEVIGSFLDAAQNDVETVQAKGIFAIPRPQKGGGRGSNVLGAALSQMAASELGMPLDSGGYSSDDMPSKPFEYYVPGFRPALHLSFNQWAQRLDSSSRLRKFARGEPAPRPEPAAERVQSEAAPSDASKTMERAARQMLKQLEALSREGSAAKGFERTAELPPAAVPRPVLPQGKPKTPGKYYEKSWAVVIGVNKYQVWPSLEYAVKDALSVKDRFLDLGFDEVIEILDEEATRARILTLLGTELPKKVGRDDRVVIFFAGHGQTEDLGEEREQGYIIPVDGDITNYFTTAISMTQVRELSQRIRAKHLLYVMDACYSGQGFNRAAGMDPAIDGYVEKITSMRSVQMITAGGRSEQVMESQGHGVFTEYFLRGLDGEADRDNDRVVTASELGAYLKPQVSLASGNLQTPQYGRLDGEGEVVFIVPRAQ
jgi:hypothetical protein